VEVKSMTLRVSSKLTHYQLNQPYWPGHVYNCVKFISKLFLFNHKH